jgi:hypothetical protein
VRPPAPHPYLALISTLNSQSVVKNTLKIRGVFTFVSASYRYKLHLIAVFVRAFIINTAPQVISLNKPFNSLAEEA